MKTWVRKTLSVGVLAAGALLVAPTAAQAEIGMISWDNDGIANGTQVAVPIQVPVNVCGTGVGAVLGLGAGSALCTNGAAHDVNVDDDEDAQYWAADQKQAKKAKKAKHESARTEGAWMVTGDNDGILNGTQVYAPIQVPVNICGTGVGALLGLGLGSAECSNGAVHDVDVESARTEGAFLGSFDNDGILNGTQVYAPIQVPVNVCGTGVGALLGFGAGQAICTNGAAHDVDVESARTEGAFLGSFDNDGILNGTQVYAPIQVPINVCGTGVGILGFGFGQAVCTNGAAHDVDVESARTEGLGMVSGDNDGILNGTQVALPIQVPVNVCGTGVGALLGFGAGQAACSNGAAWDVDADDEGGNGGNGGSDYHHRKASKKEFLPVAGGLTSGLPVVGGSGLPALGGNFAQGSQMNLAGIDPTSFLAGLPTA